MSSFAGPSSVLEVVIDDDDKDERSPVRQWQCQCSSWSSVVQRSKACSKAYAVCASFVCADHKTTSTQERNAPST